MAVDLESELDDPRQSALADYGIVEHHESDACAPLCRTSSTSIIERCFDLELARENLRRATGYMLGPVDLGQKTQVTHVYCPESAYRRPAT